VHTKEAIRFTLATAEEAVMSSLNKIQDAPTAFPTANGGCHPLWVLGHLTYVEGVTQEVLTGGANPAEDWTSLFGPGTTPTADASKYPAFDEVRARYTKLRKRTLQLLDMLSEADLDNPTTKQPKGLEALFATPSKSLLTLALHQIGHKGQITDAFRSAGRVAQTAGAGV